MGRIPAGAGNPFRAVDQKTAYGRFKASGSYDPDTLYAQKEAMLAPYRSLKRLALLGMVAGGLLTWLLGTPLVGVPVIVASLLLWRHQARQVRNVEAGYAQYVGAD